MPWLHKELGGRKEAHNMAVVHPNVLTCLYDVAVFWTSLSSPSACFRPLCSVTYLHASHYDQTKTVDILTGHIFKDLYIFPYVLKYLSVCSLLFQLTFCILQYHCASKVSRFSSSFLVRVHISDPCSAAGLI